MNIYVTYLIIAAILLAAELVYFRFADKCNIIDKPNERSSHSSIVLRGGGVIFAISILVWLGLQMVHGEWFMVLAGNNCRGGAGAGGGVCGVHEEVLSFA